jgi:hypothetical protein
MIAALRRFIAGYLPALAPMCLVSVLAASPWTMQHGVSGTISQLVTFVTACALILMLARPVAAQRLACFSWQSELLGLRQEAAARAEMMQKLSDSIGAIGQEKTQAPR